MPKINLHNAFNRVVKGAGMLVYTAVSASAFGAGGTALLAGTEKVLSQQSSEFESMMMMGLLVVGFGAAKRARAIWNEGAAQPQPVNAAIPSMYR